jgi:hypothetical protein
MKKQLSKTITKFLSGAALALMLGIVSCSGGGDNNGDGPNPGKKRDVYVVGTTEPNYIGALWKNGVRQVLSATRSDFWAEPYHVFVSGNDVYVLGDEWRYSSAGNEDYIVLWKNGVPQRIDLGGDCYLTALFVSGNDVYIVAFEYTSWTSSLWKNGVKQRLSGLSDGDNLHDVFVSGSDVYVLGNRNEIRDGYNYYQPVIWKNGVMQVLQMPKDPKDVDVSLDFGLTSTAPLSPSLSVSGNNVYVAATLTGWDSNMIRRDRPYSILWKNGVPQFLPVPEWYASDPQAVWAAEAYSVFALGNDVYVAGGVVPELPKSNMSIGVLWKNGVLQKFGFSDVIGSVNRGETQLYVSGDDIYILSLWDLYVNGVRQRLDGAYEYYSIFVK